MMRHASTEMNATTVHSTIHPTATNYPVHSEAQTYLSPLVILLIMLLFSTGLLIFRAFFVQWRRRGQAAATVPSGLLGPAPGVLVASKRPQIWDVQIGESGKSSLIDSAIGGGDELLLMWRDVMPLSATAIRANRPAPTSSPSIPNPGLSHRTRYLDIGIPHFLSRTNRRSAQEKATATPVPEPSVMLPSKLSLAFLIAMPCPHLPLQPSPREQPLAGSLTGLRGYPVLDEKPLADLVFGTMAVDCRGEAAGRVPAKG